MSLGAPRPRLLAGRASAAVHDGAGDLDLLRETRGAALPWGGVYGQLVRLTEGWTVRVAHSETIASLAATRTSGAGDDFVWRTEHTLGPFRIAQTLTLLTEPPGLHRRLRFRSLDPGATEVAVVSSFVPHLLPVLVEGIRPVEFRAQTFRDGLTVRHGSFALEVRSDPMPDHLYVNRASWRGGRRDGPLREVSADFHLHVPPDGEARLDLLLFGGLERERPRWASAATSALGDPERAVAGERAAAEARARDVPELTVPDAPWLAAAYASAVRALHRLYSSPTDGMTGLVAGYPWYSALWGRDLAWMLPAVLWLGDFDWAERSIDTLFRFQAPSDLPAFGAETGELPMQVAPGPVLIYGTSDTTWHAPTLVHRFLRHGGSPEAGVRWADGVRRALAWGDRRTDPATGLVRNGGEVAEISATTAALTRVRYGIDAPDTTIWDSADRRDHAIDLQALACEAWRAAADVLPGPTGPVGGGWRGRADRLAAAVRSRYPTPDGEYLCDSIRDGVPVPKIRPNALRAVSAGLIERATAEKFVARAAAPDLTTEWGLRTLSARDPGYRPTAYHDGQVWSIATAWAADAAFAVGDATRGVGYLRTLADRYAAEDGDANECYRGDRPEPYDSCFLLGFSVAPFLTVVFERLWGISVDARRRWVRVAPNFPADWTSAALDRLRVGPGRLSLGWSPGRLAARWTGPGDLAVETAAGTTPVAAGGAVDVSLPPPPATN